ncbi:hypothetical protein BBOV_I000920 [Babesia bovis T2Bo]|uniref:Uncharacterized protein n=1 Tax=Babesia bovis TaxID=5865 RepID=A7AXB3_BABBO|nr:hypothetical protein BBOV_I000920 [Babesia bovis T2Bo]EDO05186.1 hypothetical protein BBOV_I000920 [Babesia bovis T2Bo]|eukprot:XP_001608754.1 hypothetical protein [Babesia bovis T2Bo]
MFTMGRTVSVTSTSGRSSVLDTLMLRPPTESYERLSHDLGYTYAGFDCSVPTVSSDASSDCDVDSLASTALSQDDNSEFRTPTTRAEQLSILCSRNHHSAPACSLEYIAMTSSIRLRVEVDRDSAKTYVDSPVGRRHSHSTTASPSSKGSLSSLRRISTNSVSGHCDDVCVRLTTNSDTLGSVTADSDFTVSEDTVCALAVMHNASEIIQGKSVSDMPLGRMVHRRCVDMGTSPLNNSVGFECRSMVSSSLPVQCSVDASTSPMDSAHKSLPVYSRSLLYRIRVPLAQRLRNACSSFSEISESIGDSSLPMDTESLSTSGSKVASVDNRETLSTRLSSDSDVVISEPEPEFTFLKSMRSIPSEVNPKRRRSIDSSQDKGDLVVGETVWRRGSIHYIGPEPGESRTRRRKSNVEQLRQLLLKHYYLCSGSDRRSSRY